MSGVDLDAVEARQGDWYGSEDDFQLLPATDWSHWSHWSQIDDGETLSHFIVREDVPALIAELREARAKLAAVEFSVNVGLSTHEAMERYDELNDVGRGALAVYREIAQSLEESGDGPTSF